MFCIFEKAFDTVKHDEMVRVLTPISLNNIDVRLIMNLFWEQKADVIESEEKME